MYQLNSLISGEGRFFFYLSCCRKTYHFVSYVFIHRGHYSRFLWKLFSFTRKHILGCRKRSVYLRCSSLGMLAEDCPHAIPGHKSFRNGLVKVNEGEGRFTWLHHSTSYTRFFLDPGRYESVGPIKLVGKC